MSAGGPTLLESSSQHSLFNSFDTQGFTGLHQMSRSNDSMNHSGDGGGNSAFSDEDLIASLAGFAVEGQTERDLATIKAMLMQQQSAGNSMAGPSGNLNHHHNSFTHNSYSSSSGMNNQHWPMQSPVAATTSWSATASFPWNGNQQQQPHPNTPNLAKSLELYGNGGGNNDYYSMSGGSSGRRRDVSLERNYHFTNGGLSGSRNSSRHGTALPHVRTASGSLSSNNSAAEDMPTPGSSLDMDMGDDDIDAMEEQSTAGPSMPFINGYSGQSRPVDEMEDIQEDRLRESMEDEQQRRKREQQQLQQYPTTNARPSSSSSAPFHNQPQHNPPDSRSAHPSARATDYGSCSPPAQLGACSTTTNKQARSGTHTPINGKTISRPHSASGNHATVTSPVQTRSRSRLQMQQQEALRFTGSPAYGNGGTGS
jgi:hypothetical protein